MRKVKSNLKYLTRWFLLIGVMSGLFFSAGEGVQLLPFPAEAGISEKNSILSQNGAEKPYSISIHNSASTIVKSKSQKDFKQIVELTFQTSENQPKLIGYTAEKQADYVEQTCYDSRLLTSQSSRAPPVI